MENTGNQQCKSNCKSGKENNWDIIFHMFLYLALCFVPFCVFSYVSQHLDVFCHLPFFVSILTVEKRTARVNRIQSHTIQYVEFQLCWIKIENIQIHKTVYFSWNIFIGILKWLSMHTKHTHQFLSISKALGLRAGYHILCANKTHKNTVNRYTFRIFFQNHAVNKTKRYYEICDKFPLSGYYYSNPVSR